MTGEEMERAIALVLQQQAQLTTTVSRLAEKVDLLTDKVDLIAEKFIGLTEKVEGLAGKVDRTAESVTALLAIAEIHDRQMKETDERLNALINTVERHISEGRNGKA